MGSFRDKHGEKLKRFWKIWWIVFVILCAIIFGPMLIDYIK